MPPSTSRLAVWIGISAAVHLLAVLNMTPRVAHHFAWPAALQVEIRNAAKPDGDYEITVPGSSAWNGIAAPAVPRIETRPEARPSNPAGAQNAAVQLDLPPDQYFTAREVDVRASQINEVTLVYPQRAYEMRLGGKVMLRIFINKQGGIDSISVLAATPPGVFEEATLTATRALQFSPALKNGRQVKSQMTIEVVFNPYESINTP